MISTKPIPQNDIDNQNVQSNIRSVQLLPILNPKSFDGSPQANRIQTADT